MIKVLNVQKAKGSLNAKLYSRLPQSGFISLIVQQHSIAALEEEMKENLRFKVQGWSSKMQGKEISMGETTEEKGDKRDEGTKVGERGRWISEDVKGKRQQWSCLVPPGSTCLQQRLFTTTPFSERERRSDERGAWSPATMELLGSARLARRNCRTGQRGREL